MRINGEENFEIFKLLIEEVVNKSTINKPFADFDTNDLLELTTEINKSLSDDPSGSKRGSESTIGESTMRDYRYQYLEKEKYPFKADSQKLNILCRFCKKEHWKEYAKNNGATAQKEFGDSFYKSNDIYRTFKDQQKRLDVLFARAQKRYKTDPQSPEHIFNLGISMLWNRQLKAAEQLLGQCVQIQPFNANFCFFHVLSLMGGKRPFRHRKIDLDELLARINATIKIDQGREDCHYLTELIYKDFHQRIGYSHPDRQIITDFPGKEMLEFFSRASGISYQELAKLYHEEPHREREKT